MEITVNKIYRVGNDLARIHEVNDNIVTATELGVVRKEEVSKALVKGQKFNYLRHAYVVSEDIESIDEDTIIPAMDSTTGEIIEIPAFDGDGDFTLYNISTEISLAVDVTEDYVPWQKEIEEYIADCKIPYSSSAIKKIAVEAMKNKRELISVLSHSENWDDESLCIDTMVDVPNPSSIEDAQTVFNHIKASYSSEF